MQKRFRLKFIEVDNYLLAPAPLPFLQLAIVHRKKFFRAQLVLKLGAVKVQGQDVPLSSGTPQLFCMKASTLQGVAN